MQVLVTGGAGYIGSHTTRQLRAAGFQPVIFDNFSTGHREFVTGFDFIEGNLNRPEQLEAVFCNRPIEAVVHFASHCHVGESYTNPHKYYQDNLLNALNLLQAMTRRGVRRFIFSSTCAVYGIPDRVPIPESHPTRPINAYGHSKRCIEWMLEDFRNAHGIEHIALRYFNAAGADPGGEVGENHDPETHLIPRAFMAATGRLEQLEVYGRDYPTADGTCIRDYIHVSDLARAHVLALEKLLREEGSHLYNLGTGHGYSVRQLLAMVEQITGLTVPTVYGPRRLGDPPELVAENGHAGKDLGWEPKWSDLETIIQTAWQWYRKKRL